MANELDPNLGGIAGQDVLNVLREKILGDKGIVSSEATAAESMINESIAALQKGQAAAATGITAAAERGRIAARETGARVLTSELESRRGFATNTAVVRQIQQDTEKSLRDLDLREQEALASGQMEVASQISNLKLQQLQFNIESKRNAFSNLLSLAGLQQQQQQIGIQERQQTQAEKQFTQTFGLQERAQTQTERAAVANIALKYGLTPVEGDTIDTITARAAPFATAAEKLQIEKTKAEIAKANAEVVKLVNEGKTSGKTIDQMTADTLAATLTNPNLDPAVKDLTLSRIDSLSATESAKVLKAIDTQRRIQYSEANLIASIQADKASGASRVKVLEALESQPGMNDKEKALAKKIVENVYNPPKLTGPTKTTPLGNILRLGEPKRGINLFESERMLKEARAQAEASRQRVLKR